MNALFSIHRPLDEPARYRGLGLSRALRPAGLGQSLHCASKVEFYGPQAGFAQGWRSVKSDRMNLTETSTVVDT